MKKNIMCISDEVVWICFVCAKEFANQEQLMIHQDVCDDSLTEDSPAGQEAADSVQDIEIKPIIMPHSTISLLHNQGTKTQTFGKDSVFLPSTVTDVNSGSPTTPVPTKLTKVGTGIKSLPLGLPSRRFVRRKPFKDIYIPPPRETYFECLGLGQTPAVEEIFRSPRKSVSEDDCQIIDLTIEDKSHHSSPITPRTRSLMSQLSRDESTRRRHLSFTGTPVKSEPPTTTIENKKLSVTSDSESSDSSEEDTIKRKLIPPRSALLTIALTSPLGQRLKQHWQNDNKVPVISNIESFCKTVDQMTILEQEAADKKNPMMEKLRHRPPPQITFRFTKKYLNKWFHQYKFNKVDKREFNKILKTGLVRESRILLKQMKPCKVVLQRLKKKEIKYWTTPRVRHVQPQYVQRFKQVASSSGNYRMRPNFVTGMRNVLHPFSTTQRMVYINQKNQGMPMMPMFQQHGQFQTYRIQGSQVSQPTPRLLVRPNTGRGNDMRLEVLQINSTYPQIQGILNQPHMETQSQTSQRRKQTFNNVRTDDNLVICLSSDEEEDQSCAMCSKGSCHQHNKHLQPVNVTTDSTKLKHVRYSDRNTVQSVSKRPGVSMNGTQCISQVVDMSKQYVTNVNNMLNVTQEPNSSPKLVSLIPSKLTKQSPVVEGANNAVQENEIDIVMETADGCDPSSEQGGEGEGSGRSQSDSEYMDYEVICIDSENDEDED